MKALRIHQAARREANLATIWFGERNITLARRFRDELLSCITRIRQAPQRYPAYLHGTRRILLNKFPYSIVFLDDPEEIVIIAIAHAKRRPGYWASRS